MNEKPKFEQALINVFKNKIKQYLGGPSMFKILLVKLSEHILCFGSFHSELINRFEYKEVMIKFHLDLHVLLGETFEKYADQIEYFLTAVDK